MLLEALTREPLAPTSVLFAVVVNEIMTTHDPNHALWFVRRAALMKEGRFMSVGPAGEVMTEATLTSTYDIDVAVFNHPTRIGSDQLQVCSAWLPWRD